MNMNERLSRTLALLAILSVAAPLARAAELGPQLMVANTTNTATIDKAAEAQRLAALAAQLAQQAAQLAAESQSAASATAPAAATPIDASQPSWSSRSATDATITDVAQSTGDSLLSGWRKHRKAEDIAIRFKGQEEPSYSASTANATPIATITPLPPTTDAPAPAIASPAAKAPAGTAPAANAGEVSAFAQGINQLAAAAEGKLPESQLLSDANVQPAARTLQDNDLIPDAEPLPPAPVYGERNGKNGKRIQDDGSVSMDHGEYCGCDTCCPPQRMLFWTAGVEATFLNPDLNESVAEFGFADFTTDTVRYSSTNDVDVDSFYLAPRVWIGVQGCKWGANLRYFHLNAAEAGYDPILGSNGQWDGPDCGIPDFGYSSSNQLEAYAIDLEITRRVCLHDCAMLFSMGVRHASLSQDEMIAGAGLTDDSMVMGFANAHRESRGTGLVFGWYGRRPIFPCSCVHWFYNARFSSVWGPTQTASETGVMLAVSDPDAGVIGNAGSVNNASTYVDDTMFIGEIQLGLEWMYGLRCLPANAFFRAAVEYQRWDGGRGFTAAGSFAGAEIDDEPTTFTEAFASATEPQLDLVGFTIGTGLTW